MFEKFRKFKTVSFLVGFVFFTFSLSVLAGGLVWAESVVGEIEKPPPQIVNMVIAAIDGEPVTSNDLRQFMMAQGIHAPADIHSGQFEIRKHLRQLILSELLEKEAKQTGISVSEEEVEAYVAEIIRQNRVSEEQFQEALTKEGLTLKSYRAQVRNDIIRTRIVARSVQNKIQISDADIERFLEKNPERKPNFGDVHLQQIFIPLGGEASGGDVEEARDKALSLKELVESGEDFKQVAGSFYTDLGFLNIKDLREELRNSVEKLSPGEVSEVVRSSQGFYILSMGEGATSEDSVIHATLRESIRKELYQSKLDEKMARYFNDELPGKYGVEIKL